MGKKKEAVAKISLVVRRIFLFFLSSFNFYLLLLFFLIYQRMGILRMEKSIVLVTCMLLVVSSFVESNPIQSNRDEDCLEYGEYDGSCSEQKQACCYGLKCRDSRDPEFPGFACLPVWGKL